MGGGDDHVVGEEEDDARCGVPIERLLNDGLDDPELERMRKGLGGSALLRKARSGSADL